MVRNLFIFLFPLSVFATFRMECSKLIYFEGESVDCQFLLHSKAPAVEVEVQKFPEFRGFWSENLALRQGVLTTGQLFQNFRLPNQPIISTNFGIGTYLITPMLRSKEYQILPMKVVVKGYGNHRDEVLESTKAEMRVLPLPPIPAHQAQYKFSGLVGHGRLFLESPEVKFETDQSTSLRYTIDGDGNFQELSALPLDLPKNVELISERSSLSGNSRMGAKRFEMTLSVHSNENLQIPRKEFLIFNPLSKQYDKLVFPGVDLIRMQSQTTHHQLPAEEPPQTSNHLLLEKLTHLKELPWIPILAITSLVSVIGFLLWKTFQWIKKPRARKPAKAKPPTLEGGDFPSLLRSGYQIALNELLRRTQLRPSSPRRQALEAANLILPPELLGKFDKIFTAYDQLFYSPSHSTSLTPESLQESVAAILKAS